MTRSRMTLENTTGIRRNPELTVEMTNAAELFPPSSSGESLEIGEVRTVYAREHVKLVDYVDLTEKTGMLLDKLGERLAFERAGTRLYEALLSKYDAYGSFAGGPSREDIAHILAEELEHFDLLQEAIRSLDGDPTELTPSANVQLVASQGIAQVVTDPRINLIQSLEVIAVAELADNECWESLGELASQAGHDDLARQCAEALQTEQEHLAKVRTWLAAAQGRVPTPRHVAHH